MLMQRTMSSAEKCTSLALIVAYVMLPVATTVILKTYSCETFDDGSRMLRADYSIDCDSSRHQLFAVYSGMMVVLYPLGVDWAH